MQKWAKIAVVAILLSGCARAELDEALTYTPPPEQMPAPRLVSLSAPFDNQRCQEYVSSDIAKARAAGFDDATVKRMGASTTQHCLFIAGTR